jgi:hypothetical protein
VKGRHRIPVIRQAEQRRTSVLRTALAGLSERLPDDQANFRFHGPGGSESDYAGLTACSASIRAAFDGRKITRGIIVAESHTEACQTWIEGTFVREFTQSPAGPLLPTGTRVVMDLISIFLFDDDGRLTVEFVRTDYRSFLPQLGPPGR